MKVTIIGSGNVGHHLGHRFKEKGVDILEVFSRRKSNAAKLAKSLGCHAEHDLRKINATADLYIIAVKDGVIGNVAEVLSNNAGMKNKLVVHTSGATPSTLLKPFFKNYGIFYPLQSFSISKEVDFDHIPICIDSSRKSNRVKLLALAKKISLKTYEVNDKQRSVLHVAAVFVNNFSNYLYQIGQEICDQEKVDFDILKPLILETAKKIQDNDPKAMQTGPAIRGDQETIDRHLAFLKTFPEWAELYHTMTKMIQ